MLIGISTLVADPLGDFLFDIDPSKSRLDNRTRRVSRVATLDGSSATMDSGYSDTDRTIVAELGTLTELEWMRLRYIFMMYSTVLLFLPDGAFRASPESLSKTTSRHSVTFLISGAGALNA
jgi:hypothetical protein